MAWAPILALVILVVGLVLVVREAAANTRRWGPKTAFNRTVQKLRFWVPSALRAPAAG